MISRGRKFARLPEKSGIAFVAACSWLAVLAGCADPSHAVDQPACFDDDCPVSDLPEVSREEWQLRVQEAKRRAQEVARFRREHPELYTPIPEDPEIAASERVLTDDSLRPGDIVSTKRGLFVYRGRSDQPPREDDFVPIVPRSGFGR